jgi:hypothetical protein
VCSRYHPFTPIRSARYIDPKQLTGQGLDINNILINFFDIVNDFYIFDALTMPPRLLIMQAAYQVIINVSKGAVYMSSRMVIAA